MVPIRLARPRRFTLAARAPAGIMALEVGLLLSPAFLAAFIGPSFFAGQWKRLGACHVVDFNLNRRP